MILGNDIGVPNLYYNVSEWDVVSYEVAFIVPRAKYWAAGYHYLETLSLIDR